MVSNVLLEKFTVDTYCNGIHFHWQRISFLTTAFEIDTFSTFFLFKCSVRKWTGSNKLNSILVTRAFLIFTIWGWFELALWSIIWLTVYSLICKNNIFVVLDAFKVPPCIYIDMHLKGDENTPKNPTSTKWNNILIRLEHAHRSFTTRSPLNRPLKLPLTATSLHQSLYQHQETAVFAQNGNKNGVESSSVKLSDSVLGTQFGQTRRCWTWIRKSFVKPLLFM